MAQAPALGEIPRRVSSNFHIYEVTYRLTAGTVDMTANETATGPVQALNHFHRNMQLKAKHYASGYRVTALHRVVWQSSGSPLKSAYDLPRTPTPDLRHKGAPAGNVTVHDLPLGLPFE